MSISAEAEAIVRGNIVRLQVVFRNRKDEPEDPTKVVLWIDPPGPPPATRLFPEAVNEPNPGEFAYEFEPATGGTWRFKFAGTEGLIAAAKGTFTIDND